MSEFLTIPKWYDTSGNKCEGYPFNVGGTNSPVYIKNGKVTDEGFNSSSTDFTNFCNNLIDICAGFANQNTGKGNANFNKDSAVTDVITYLAVGGGFGKGRIIGDDPFWADVCNFRKADGTLGSGRTYHSFITAKISSLESDTSTNFLVAEIETHIFIKYPANSGLLESCKIQVSGRFVPATEGGSISCINFINSAGVFQSLGTLSISTIVKRHTETYT